MNSPDLVAPLPWRSARARESRPSSSSWQSLRWREFLTVNIQKVGKLPTTGDKWQVQIKTTMLACNFLQTLETCRQFCYALRDILCHFPVVEGIKGSFCSVIRTFPHEIAQFFVFQAKECTKCKILYQTYGHCKWPWIRQRVSEGPPWTIETAAPKAGSVSKTTSFIRELGAKNRSIVSRPYVYLFLSQRIVTFIPNPREPNESYLHLNVQFYH